MIVRRRYARLVVDVRQDLKTELRVFIQHMQSARRLFAMLTDEFRVLQELFEVRADLFAAARSRITRQDGTTIRDELVELISHCLHSKASSFPGIFAH